MKSLTFQAAINTVVVVGIFLASLSQSVYGQITNKNIQALLQKESPLNRTYIKSPDGERLPRRKPKFKCRMWYNCVQFEEVGKTDHRWECSFDEGIAEGNVDRRIVGLKGEKINDWLEANGAVSGKTVMVLSEAELKEDRIIVDKEQVVRFENYDEGEAAERRLAYPETGILNTLVVRVKSNRGSPPPSAQLSEDIFDDSDCLKTQYDKCSYGKLQVQEYIPGTIADVPTEPNAPGVVEINVFTLSRSTVETQIQANRALRQLFGADPGSIFDAVMFCFPPGLDGIDGGNWLAYAYLGRWDSYYNDEWCLKLSSQMHEVGHNLGLQHAGEYTGSEGEQEYGDQTDMMGFSYFEDDSPRMCFNNAKNWQLGWYDDKNLEINAGLDLSFEPKSFVLNGFVDYGDDTSDRYIVLKIGDFYVGYNRAVTFNEDVRESPNLVTIQEMETPIYSFPKSKVAAKLAVGGSSILNIGYVSVLVTYSSNSNSNTKSGKDAVVEISLIGEPVVCQGESDASIEVELVTDNNPQETSWGIANSEGEYIYYNPRGTYTDGLTTYTETVPGLCRGLEYFFVIEDSFGDGLSYNRGGDGSYKVSFEGLTIFEGGEFLLQEAKPFTLPLDGCVDNPTFEYRGLDGKDCNFLAGLPESTIITGCGKRANSDTSDSTKVYEYCKATCDGVGIAEVCPN